MGDSVSPGTADPTSLAKTARRCCSLVGCFLAPSRKEPLLLPVFLFFSSSDNSSAAPSHPTLIPFFGFSRDSQRLHCPDIVEKVCLMAFVEL